MKKVTFSLVFLVLCFSFNLKAQSEDCNGYFAYKKGTKMDITFYDKKDKPTTILKYEVTKNEQRGNETLISFKNDTHDKKDNFVVSGDYDIICRDGQVYADVRNVVASMLPMSADTEVSVTGDKLTYPHNLTAGQKLDDVSATIKAGTGSITIITITMNMSNRKVEGMETVETPAGKFDCVKITYDSDVKMGIMGTKRQQVTEYLAKGVGLVKSVSMEKGKLVSWQQITKLER